jgi:DNA-binding NarL/FixJ family response regulator
MPDPIRLLVVDDTASVRRSLRLRLGLETDMLIAGEAADAHKALELAEALRPDVVLLDLALASDDDGLAVSVELAARVPESATIMISHHDDVHTRRRAAAAGAVALIGKRQPINALLAAIRRAAVRSFD